LCRAIQCTPDPAGRCAAGLDPPFVLLVSVALDAAIQYHHRGLFASHNLF